MSLFDNFVETCQLYAEPGQSYLTLSVAAAGGAGEAKPSLDSLCQLLSARYLGQQQCGGALLAAGEQL